MRFIALSTACRALKRVRRMRGDETGVTAIEFAIVVVPFFGLVLLILQVALYHFSLQSLDFAVRQAGRTVMTGQVAASAVSASTFKTTYVCPKVFWGISCDKLVINSYVVGRSSDAAASSGIYAFINAQTRSLKDPATTPEPQNFCFGAPGDFVYLDVAYPYPNFVRNLLMSGAPDTWMMRSSTVAFNEPNARNAGATC